MKSVYLQLFLIKIMPCKLDLQDRDINLERNWKKIIKWMEDIIGKGLLDQFAELYKHLKIMQLHMGTWSYVL